VFDHELATHRRQDHAGDENDVEVHVRVASELYRVGCLLEPPLRDPREVVEVEPPHGGGAEEGEGSTRRTA
jgi:hypothetical protein